MYDPDLADRMEEMDPQLRAMLGDEITSFVTWDVVRFFVESEQEEGTLDEVAEAVGRAPADMLGAVNDLVRAGLLGRRGGDDATHYVLTQERRRRDLVERFVAATHDRDFRLKVIYHLLRAE